MKRIAALVPNVLAWAPGQRLRIESWAHYLREAGWAVDVYPFEDARLHEVLYDPGPVTKKAWRLLDCYARQLARVLAALPCDVLLIHREAALLGPALIERVAARRRVPVVYDIDDPLFVRYRSPVNGWLSLLKSPSKTRALFRLSDHVIAINDLIGSYAARFNPCVSVIPNCVDTERYVPDLSGDGEPPRLVWIGSHSTVANLETIATPLRRLQAVTGVSLRVIGARSVELEGVVMEFKRWSAATEIADLQTCQVGLVPLSDLPWNHWKFFFKTIQYMALGLPVVAQKIGSNGEIIKDGINGFLVDTEDEWLDRMTTLVMDRERRQRMGRAARATVVERYSTQAQMPRVVSLFENVLARWGDSEAPGSPRLPRRSGTLR